MPTKKDLASKLSGSQPGWRDTITAKKTTPAEPEQKKPTFKRKTYLLTPDLIGKIETLAGKKRVGINELVRYLLNSAIDQIEAGEMNIPTEPGKRHITQ